MKTEDRISLFIITLVFLLGFLTLFSPRVSSDGAQYFEFLQSLAHDHDINFYNERQFYTPRYIPIFPYNRDSEKFDYPVNIFTIGPTVFWAPGQLVLSAIEGFLCIGKPLQSFRAPFSLASQFFACFASSAAVYVALLVLYIFLRLYFSSRSSLFSVLFLLLVTPLPAFAFVTPAFAHGFGFLLSVLFLVTIDRIIRHENEKQIFWYLFFGFVTGLFALQRLQALFFLIIPLFHWLFVFISALTARNSRFERFKKVTLGYCLAGMVTVVAFVPQLLVQSTIFHSLLADPQGSSGMHWTSLNFMLVLFHKTRGLFTVNPLLFFATIGLLWWAWHRRNFMSVLFVVALLVQLYINMVRRDWCGVGFGMRRFVESLPLLAFGFAHFFAKLEGHSFKHKKIVPILLLWVLILAACWNVLLMGQYYYGPYGDPNQTLKMTYSDLVRNQFTIAPGMVGTLVSRSFPVAAFLRAVIDVSFTEMFQRGILVICTLVVFCGLGACIGYAIKFSQRAVRWILLTGSVYLIMFDMFLYASLSCTETIRVIPFDPVINQVTNIQPLRLSVGNTKRSIGQLSHIHFSQSGIFYVRRQWQYSLYPFVSTGKIVPSKHYVSQSTKPIEFSFPKPIPAQSLTIALSHENHISIKNTGSGVLATVAMKTTSAEIHQGELKFGNLQNDGDVLLPLNWQSPELPEETGFFFNPEADYRPISLMVFPLPSTAMVTEIKITKNPDAEPFSIHGIAFRE